MGKVILIVEDEPRNLKLMRRLLQASGYTTIEATDGKQGVELARIRMPDLILMDIQLPVIDGLEATKTLKADTDTKDIPIVALTGHAMPGDEQRIREAGCDEYIGKPIVDIRAFLETVERHLSK